MRPWKCCGWSIGPYACFVPPPSPPIQIWPPNRTQRLNVAAPAECLNWKLPANRSFPSVVYLTEKQRGGRMNSELRFYFTSCLSRPFTLYRSAPPSLAKKCTSLGAASQHCTKSQNVNCRSFVARELLGRSSLYKFFLMPSWFDSCPRRRHLFFQLGWLFRGKYADIEICLLCDENFVRTLCPFPDKIYKVCT